MHVQGLARVGFIVLAGIFFVLGVTGIVVPGLPTTPFLLLTSYLLARSSPRLHRILLANKLVGPILAQWQKHRSVSLRVKIQAAVLVALTMLFLVGFPTLPPVLLTIVLVLAAIGMCVIHQLPTAPHPRANVDAGGVIPRQAEYLQEESNL